MPGIGPKDVASAATSAAPVGVTSSLSMSTPWIGAPSSRVSVAGAGSGRGGRGQRQAAVRGVDEAAPDRERGADDRVDVERLQRERDAGDLADRVDGADLVEMHLLGRD